MNSLEEFLLNIGCSWQTSMLLPFLIVLVFGTFIVFLLFKKSYSKMFRAVLALIIGLSLTGSYFAVYPVYVSDLNNDYRSENVVSSIDTSSTFLEVLVIPDCPHCVYSTGLIKKLSLRNNDAQIVYKVVSNDGYGGAIEEKLKHTGLKYIFSVHDANIKILTQGSFPSFVFHEKGSGALQVWNNNSFGSKALDYIEAKL